MLAIISSAKTLDFDSEIPKGVQVGELLFEKESKQLLKVLQKYNSLGLQRLLGISKKLGDENFERFQSYTQTPQRPALFAYKGDVYRSLQLEHYRTAELRYAHKHIVIVSGLYGIVRALDGIKPYRLEMSTVHLSDKIPNLYAFWGRKLSDYVNSQENGSKGVLINLASKEYSSAICTANLKVPVVDVEFKERRNGTLRTIALMAKRARGAMANYMIQNKVRNPEELKDFQWQGYRFQAKLSEPTRYLFVK